MTSAAKTSSYEWSRLADAPDASGIYAWYYRPHLSVPDVQAVKAELTVIGDPNDRQALVRTFLERHVYGLLTEPDFEAAISGPLKPRYEGTLSHRPALTPALLERLSNDPSAFDDLRQLFEGDIHLLSSPLYIGMAKSLRRRLAAHRNLIEVFREGGQAAANPDDDHSFARTVHARGIRPSRLMVCVQIATVSERMVNLENILNRVFFPIFGRN